MNRKIQDALAVLAGEWEHAVGETDENRPFDIWLFEQISKTEVTEPD